jgi:hypothetical protein
MSGVGFTAELSKKVEDVINATVKSKPDEPISFMVRFGGSACA